MPVRVQQALEILERYDLNVPAHVIAWLNSEAAETPKAGDPGLSRVRNILIAAPYASLRAAAAYARAQGVQPLILGDAIEGEARECAKMHAGIAISCATHGEPAAAPCVLISGGETTVTVRGRGRGGRNAEFLLSLALALQGSAADLGDCVRYRWHRRYAGQCRRASGARHAERAAAWGINVVPRLLDDNDAYRVFDAE
jgi:glycerate 2-kinase